MARKTNPEARGEMLAGTLDMLILKTVLVAPAHGHTIAHVIEKSSDEVLEVEHGSLYPALHKLERQGLIASFGEHPKVIEKPSIIALRRQAGAI